MATFVSFILQSDASMASMRNPLFGNDDAKRAAPHFCVGGRTRCRGCSGARFFTLIGWAAASALVCFALRAVVLEDVRPERKLHIFWHLFLRDEPTAAVLGLGIVLASVLVARHLWPAALDGALERLAARPWTFIAAATATLAVAALIVYRRHPLSMDEYAPLFQARAFARGSLLGRGAARSPAEARPHPQRRLPRSLGHGRVILLLLAGLRLAPDSVRGARRSLLLNPLLGGATLWIVWRLARRLCFALAAGWAVLLDGRLSRVRGERDLLYSMGAHLCSTCSRLADLEPEPRRLFAGGAVGSFALALHNPVPHLLFPLPWMAWIGLRQGGARR